MISLVQLEWLVREVGIRRGRTFLALELLLVQRQTLPEVAAAMGVRVESLERLLRRFRVRVSHLPEKPGTAARLAMARARLEEPPEDAQAAVLRELARIIYQAAVTGAKPASSPTTPTYDERGRPVGQPARCLTPQDVERIVGGR